MTRFEIGEFLAADGVDKEIVGLLIQSFGDTRKSATEPFQFWDVHEHTTRRRADTLLPTLSPVGRVVRRRAMLQISFLRLEEFDGVARRVLAENLAPSRTLDRIRSESSTLCGDLLHGCFDILDLDHKTVPSSGRWNRSIGQR